MASVDGELKIAWAIRPVIFDGDVRGLFHTWNTGGFAIIELESGVAKAYHYSQFRFIDSKEAFDCFTWPEGHFND